MSAKSIPFGPAPWHQTNWDWRAAGNFIGGGVGCGLIVFTVLSGAAGVPRAALLLAGLAFVGLGLGSVALELGRPLRAPNVLRNPWKSWMSREAIVAPLLVLATIAAAAGYDMLDAISGALALAFVYCQARLLQAAKGIPAWHDKRVIPLLLTTALAEGGGVFWLTAPWHGAGSTRLLLGFAALLLLRIVLCHLYRRRVLEKSRAAGAALKTSARTLMLAGTLVPLVLIASTTILPYTYAMQAAAVAGLLAWLAGAYLKFSIITRAAFNRGFTLPQMPVRGTRA